MRDVRPTTVALAVAAVLLIATRQAYTVRFTGLGLSPAQLVLFVLVALWALTRLLGHRDAARLGLLSGLAALLLAETLASYGLRQNAPLDPDLRTSSDRTILLLALAVGTVVVLATLLRTRRDIEYVLRALVIGGALSGMFAIVQFGTGIDIASYLHAPGLADTGGTAATLLRGGLERPQGAASAPLELGGVLTILVPIGLGVAFAARRGGRRAWPWALAVGFIAFGGVVSLSRSVFLGLAAALLVMVPRWPVRRALMGLAGALVVLAATAVFATSLVSTLITLLVQGSQDYSLDSRSDGRTYVWNHFAEHFWFGQGPGTYDLTKQNVLDNQFLSQLMESGALGALLLVAVLGCALVYAIRAARRVRPGDAAAAELANGLAGALAAIVVVSAVLDTSGFAQVFTLIWFVIGLAGALWRVNVRDAPSAATPAVTPVAVAVR